MLARIGDEGLREQLAHWAATRLPCDPADRETAERGVRLAYRAAGLEPPATIIWCRGPVEIARSVARAVPRRRLGGNARTKVYDEVCAQLGMAAKARRAAVFDADLEI